MQAINLNRVMSYGMGNNTVGFYVFYFDGAMPTDISSLPFDYTDLAAIKDNCLSIDYYNETTGAYTPGESRLQPAPKVFTDDSIISTLSESVDDGEGGTTTVETQLYNLPIKYCTADTTGPMTRWTNFGTFKELSNVYNNSNFTRIGREGSCLYIQLDESIKDTYQIDAWNFRQRTINSRQKRPSWQGSGSYNTRCTVAALDYYDRDTSTWVNGPNTNVDANVFGSRKLATPIIGRDLLRIRCIDGPVLNGYIVSSGDPHWSCSSFALQTKTVISSSPTYTWALVVPNNQSFSWSSDSWPATVPFDLNQNTQIEVPIMLADVGDAGSGATIELINNPVPNGQYPQIHKFNLLFKQ